MAKNYEAPQIEKTTPAVVNDEGTDKAVIINKSATKKVEMTLTDIYKGQIDKFKSFISGEYAHNGEDERAEAQMDFINMVNNILDAEFPVMKECTDYLIFSLRDNPTIFTNESLLEGYWSQKKRPNKEIMTPYISFMDFALGLSKNLQRKKAFLDGYGVVKLQHMFNQKQAYNLQVYLFG